MYTSIFLLFFFLSYLSNCIYLHIYSSTILPIYYFFLIHRSIYIFFQWNLTFIGKTAFGQSFVSVILSMQEKYLITELRSLLRGEKYWILLLQSSVLWFYGGEWFTELIESKLDWKWISFLATTLISFSM